MLSEPHEESCAPENADGGVMEQLISQSIRPAMVVTHPDDESVWGAGMLLRYPKNWDVICLTTPDRDPERAELFVKACKVLGVNPILIGLDEKKKIDFGKVDLSPYDLFVTHNSHGEYGHPQHIEVHRYLMDNYKDKTICFGYRPKRDSVADFEIALTPDECKKKLEAIQCYDNIRYNNRTTWTILLDAFTPKFNLWVEPYEWAIRLFPFCAPLRRILMAGISAIC